jgi:hypothetical protein
VECLARGEHEATEAITRAEMAVIDAAYWESLCPLDDDIRLWQCQLCKYEPLPN